MLMNYLDDESLRIEHLVLALGVDCFGCLE